VTSLIAMVPLSDCRTPTLTVPPLSAGADAVEAEPPPDLEHATTATPANKTAIRRPALTPLFISKDPYSQTFQEIREYSAAMPQHSAIRHIGI